MSFDGFAGLHCLVIHKIIKVPIGRVVSANHDPNPSHSSALDFWVGPVLDDLAKVFTDTRVLTTKSQLVADPNRGTKAREMFGKYCTTLFPWSRLASSSPIPGEQETIDQVEQIRHLLDIFGDDLELRACIRSPENPPPPNAPMDDPVLAYLKNSTSFSKEKAAALSAIPRFGSAIVESLVMTRPHIIPVHLPSSAAQKWLTVLSIYVIPIGACARPPHAGGRVDELESRWSSFCAYIFDKSPSEYKWRNTPAKPVGWELVIDRPRLPIPANGETALYGGTRFASVPIKLYSSHERNVLVNKTRTSFSSLGDLYKFMSTQMLVTGDTPWLMPQISQLRGRAHNGLFCCRLPTTMWNHVTPLPTQNHFGAENIAPVAPPAGSGGKGALLGKGSFGTVVAVEWIYANNNETLVHRKLESHIASIMPGVENMAVVQELLSFIKSVRSCITATGSNSSSVTFDMRGLERIATSANVVRMSLDVDIVTTSGAPVRTAILPVILTIQPRPGHAQPKPESLAKFYASSLVFAEAVVKVMTQAEASKYQGQRMTTIDVSRALIAAYVEHMGGSWSTIETALVDEGYPSRVLVILKSVSKVVSSARARVSMHTHMFAALKTSTPKSEDDHFLWECSLMQFFAAYALSPSSIDGVYNKMGTYFPDVYTSNSNARTLALISRNDISTGAIPLAGVGGGAVQRLSDGYLAAVHPENRALNPRAYLEIDKFLTVGRSSASIVFHDDDSELIGVKGFAHPLNQEMFKLWPFTTSSATLDQDLASTATVERHRTAVIRIPPPCSSSTLPVYGATVLRGGLERVEIVASRMGTVSDIMIMPKMQNGSLGDVLRTFGEALWRITVKPMMIQAAAVVVSPSVPTLTMASVYENSTTGGALNLLKIVQAFADMSGALAFVNSHGVAHLDFKPGNVVMDADYKAYLTDFGMSATYGTLATLGTRTYLPPYFTPALEGQVIVRDSVFDAIMLGNSILDALFDAAPDSPLGQFIAQHDQTKARGILDNALKWGRLKEGSASPLLFSAQYLAFAGMTVGDEGVEWYKSHWSTVVNIRPGWLNAATMQRLVIPSGTPIPTNQSRVPINPVVAEYVVEQMFEMGMWLSAMDPSQYDAYKITQEMVTNTPALTDDSTGGFCEEWYMLSMEKRRAYGFMTRLKMAEAQMRWMCSLIERDQSSTFEALQKQSRVPTM